MTITIDKRVVDEASKHNFYSRKPDNGGVVAVPSGSGSQ
jgi:hypothetical protein